MKTLLQNVGKRLVIFAFLISPFTSFSQNPWNGKIVLQGYWWDYWNANYPYSWSNYLSDLAPRLRELGIDMVWVPPFSKNANLDKVGYTPFDLYDLGDKYQKGFTGTRVGNKDELLRMIAIMHANGLGVVEDVVINHAGDAGAKDGEGGQDKESTYSMKSENGYKNFRYACYATPATDETEANYLQRKGRWPKNYQNFHPNAVANTTTGNWAVNWFGPDFVYEHADSYGLSTTSGIYNPAQYSGYNTAQARDWLIWMKKQTGIDGLRWDAVKLFPHYTAQDLIWNVKYNAGWAGGGPEMFNVAEYIGNRAEIDKWVNDVQYSNGGTEELAGTFDTGLREQLRTMAYSLGSYNLGDIVNYQQDRRYRTVPFVNSHDTFRPKLDSIGKYIGWKTGDELCLGHIDPFESRLSVAYAVALSVDGSPQIFFEDLFDVSNGKRFSHLPTSAADLPVRPEIANLIWCHQKLNFKAGSYKVRWQAADLLIIERSKKAVIGINDNWNTWQIATIQTDWAPGTVLHDYSGANVADITVDASGKITVWVPPCDGTGKVRGYCVWGPTGITGGFSPSQNATTQEWEMADDLGDSHPLSLQQGGALPKNSTALRTAGKIYVEGGKLITINLYPSDNTVELAVVLYDSTGATSVASKIGKGGLTLTYTPSYTGYYVIKTKNNSVSNPSQKVWIKANYIAPRFTDGKSRFYKSKTPIKSLRKDDGIMKIHSSEFTQQKTTLYPNPTRGQVHLAVQVVKEGWVKVTISNAGGEERMHISQYMGVGSYDQVIDISSLEPGLYMYKIMLPDEKMIVDRLVIN